MNSKFNDRGYTLVEVIVSVAVFTIFAIGIYSAITYVLKAVTQSKLKIIETSVLNDEMEFIKSLSYDKIGLINGISSEIIPEGAVVPWGILSERKVVKKDNFQFIVTTTVYTIDDSFDGTSSSTPPDNSPNDYKLVQLQVNCLDCTKVPLVFSSFQVPAGLEGSTTTGSIFLQVVDSVGTPVSGANIQITNSLVNPNVSINTTSNANGQFGMLNAPTSTLGYNIFVSKSGFSSDFTTSSSPINPNPTRLPATVVGNNTTNISFAIDQVSSANVQTLDKNCGVLGSIPFVLRGEKIIGSFPVIYKYNQVHTTNASGLTSLSNLEWDDYQIFSTGTTKSLIGTIPLSPFTISSGSVQNLTLIFDNYSANSLLVKVEDAGTGLPISGTSVKLSKISFENTKLTGLGHIIQTDWSGGIGTDPNQYSSQNGGIDATVSGDLKLISAGNYVSQGILESHTFNLGTTVDLRNIYVTSVVVPENGADPVRIRIATSSVANPSNWDYFGPDGTASTYFTPSNNSITGVSANYFRYEIELLTADQNFTPTVSDFSLTFTNGCQAPGQVFFENLSPDTYTLEVSKAGYTSSIGNIIVNGNSDALVRLSP